MVRVGIQGFGARYQRDYKLIGEIVMFGKKNDSENDDKIIRLDSVTDSVADSEKENAAAGAAKSDVITLVDGFGRKINIDKSKYMKEILPNQLKQVWDKPVELYRTIMQALREQAGPYVLEAAQHLQEIDDIKERGAVTYALVLISNKSYDDAENVLNKYMEENGRTAIALSNLSNVYRAKGDQAKSNEVLEESIKLNPDQNVALPAYLAVKKNEGGEEAMFKALDELEKIEGSVFPKLFHAIYFLDNKKLEEARPYLDYLIAEHKSNPEVMINVTGSLGKNGYSSEVIRLTADLYDPAKQDARIGMNILRAYNELGDYENGTKLLNRMMLLNRPDLREFLMSMSNSFDAKRAKNEQQVVPTKDSKQTVVVLEKPVWCYGLADTQWVEPKVNSVKKIGFMTFANPRIETESHTEREDDSGRLSRSIPLYLQEIFAYSTDMQSVSYFPSVVGVGPIVVGKPWDKDFLRMALKQYKLDYLVTGSVAGDGENYEIAFVMINAVTDDVVVDKFKTTKGGFAEDFNANVDKLYNRITGKEHVELDESVDAIYELPSEKLTLHYLTGLGQLLTQTFIENKISDRDKMWGERNMINWYIQLALGMPDNAIPYIMAVSGAARSRAYGTQTFLEFRNQIAGLVANMKGNDKVKEHLVKEVARIYGLTKKV